ncbi:MAG: ORF6N domain-containing protein [Gemmatimonadaceae bacterium]
MHSLDAVIGRIHLVRGMRVILDADLAKLYGVETRRLNEQVRRNCGRFPSEFVFRLTNHELMRLMSQFATSNGGRGGIRKAPLAFTEHGAIMAATVLNSARAIEVSVYVVRAFVQIRNSFHANTEVATRLDQLERKVGSHDQAIVEILRVLRALTSPAEAPNRRRIGFVQDD